MKLNIGCGRDYKEGWWNCDISSTIKCDCVLDIRKEALPFPDNSVELIYISGVLEQIASSEELIFALNECYRVLTPGKTINIVVPNAQYSIAHQDPMDVRKFTPKTFHYFFKDAREYKLYGSIYGFKSWSSLAIQENIRHILTITMTK